MRQSSPFGSRAPCRSSPGGYSLDEVLDAVETVMPAIEVVGCRFEGGYDGLGAIRLVADMTAHTAFVSGRGTATVARTGPFVPRSKAV